MTVYFSGYVFQDDGDALNGATVQLLQVSDAAEEASTTTNSDGFWSFNEADEDQYDVKITSGTSVRYRKWADEISLKMIDVRNNEGNTVPAAVFANHTNNADNDIVHYRGLRGTGADNDEMFFRYYMDDASSNTTEVARMTVKLISASAASEDSEIRWGVAVGGSIVDVFTISNTSGGATDMTMDVAGDINLDADGGDVFFKDGGTTFGSATNNSGNLIIKSGTTTALTFSGANLTAAGTIGSGAITSSGSITSGGSFIIGSASIAESELEMIDGITAGTVAASKAVVVDGNKDIGTFRNVTIDGTFSDGNYTFDTSGNVSGLGTVSSGTITTSGNIELGHASDTTLTRSGSGDVTIEGNAIYRAGGTDVPVADGGTGASTLTDGGILLGSGTNAITAMAVLTDGQMIVGDGTTDPVAESGATLRTSIGVGTGDSPQFTDLTLTDDLTLNSDSAVFNMGDGNDFTITHDGTTGATLAGNPITITSAGAATWSTSSGALTLTSAAAATWSTAAGALTIDGDDGIVLQTTGSGNVEVNETLDLKDNTLDNVGNANSSWVDGTLTVENNGFAGEIIRGYSTTAGTTSYLSLSRSNHGTLGTHGAVDANDTLGNINFTGSDGDSFETGSRISAIPTETFSGSARGTKLNFYTVDNTTTALDERMTISHGGNIGIGETAPANLLHVKVDDVGVDPHTSAQIVLERDGTNYLQFLTADDGTSGLLFGRGPTGGGSGADDAASKIYYDHNVKTMYFEVEDNQSVITIDADVGDKRITFGDAGDEQTTEGLLYVNPNAHTVGANRPYHYMYMSNNNVITIPSGTASLVTALNIEIPNITATGTVTNTATVRIAGAMDEGGTGNYALLVDGGLSRFDGRVDAWVGAATSFQHSHTDGTGRWVALYDSGSGSAAGFGIYSATTGDYLIHENDENLLLLHEGAGHVWIGPDGEGTDNFNNTKMNGAPGLTINQEGNNGDILAFKSSDVGHGVTDFAETDTYARFTNHHDTQGGLQIMGFRDDNTIALELRGTEVDDNTAKSSSAEAPVQVNAFKKASATVAGIGTNGNVFAAKSNDVTKFLVDVEGQIYATADGHTGDISVGQLADKYDDALLVRALDHVKTSAGTKGMIEDKWDDFVKYNEQDLVDAGVLGESIENGGLLNVTGLQRLHNGAIWQGYTRQMEQEERIKELETRLLALEGGK